MGFGDLALGSRIGGLGRLGGRFAEIAANLSFGIRRVLEGGGGVLGLRYYADLGEVMTADGIMSLVRGIWSKI